MKSDKNTPEETQKIEVLMLPSFAENPYQSMLGEALKEKGVGVHYCHYSHGKLPILRAATNQKNKTGLDVIHLHWIHTYLEEQDKETHAWLYAKFLLDVAIARFVFGFKFVWTIHNQLSHNSRLPKIELQTRRALSRLVDRMIVMSDFSLTSTGKLYKINPQKITMIPHGNYRKYYHPPIDRHGARKQLKLPKIGKIYMSFGLLKPYKGIEDMLKIWAENREYFENDTLFIVGKPYNEEYGEKIKKMTDKMEGVILDLGFVEDDKISLYFSAADLVILPFKNILNSGSLLLAMSYGKPIVAPRLGSIEEVLQEADSLLYDPQDESGLAQAWQKSTQIDLEKLGDIVAKVCDRYDWDRIAEQTLQVYLSTLKSDKN